MDCREFHCIQFHISTSLSAFVVDCMNGTTRFIDCELILSELDNLPPSAYCDVKVS